MQLAHQQTEQALATLTHLHSVAPKHDYVTMLLARAHHELEDWRALVRLLPDVRRKKLLQPARLRRMEIDGYCGILELAAHSQQEFEASWLTVPKDLQVDPELLHCYLDRFIRNGWKGISQKAEVFDFHVSDDGAGDHSHETAMDGR